MNYTKIFRSVSLSLFLLSGINGYSLPAQIIVIPSAEQQNGSLTLKGQERAMALAPYLTSTSNYLSAGPFSALFACKPTRDNSSLASMQTFIPLGQRLSLPVRMPYGVGQHSQMAALLLTDPLYDGQSIILTWEQTDMSNIIGALGYSYTPPSSTQSAYAYILPYPTSTMSPNKQKLLFDDPS